jgi:hypothetical protein
LKLLLKIWILTLCLGLSVTGFSQSVTAPSATSYAQSTTNQTASGFSVSGFNTSTTLLVTVGLVNPPTGTTLRFNTTSGVSASTGYNISSNFTRISFTGTQANINTVLASLRVNTGSVPGNLYIAVTATENPTGYFYLPSNGHFYRPISGSTTYTSAKSAAASQTFKGQSGYLVTITSQDEQNFINANVPVSNIWFALSDAGLEGRWRIDAGPENGTLVWTASANVNNSTTGSYSSSGTTASGQFTAWASGEPNNSDGSIGEDHAVTKWGGANTWNDLRDGNSSGIGGYVAEFGTWTDPANQTFTDFFTGFVTHQIACSPATSPSAPAGADGSRTLAGTVSLSATTGSGITADWYANATGGNVLSGGAGTLSYTTPSISATTTYYVQARNSSTGCVSSTRTAVVATVNYPTPFTYSGTIYNSEGIGLVNIPVGLYYRTKSSGGAYSLFQTYTTNSTGVFSISTSLDITVYDFQVTISSLSVSNPEIADANFFTDKVLSQSFTAKDYYRMNTNGNSALTVTDVFLVYQKRNGAGWPAGVPAYRIFTQAEWSTINTSSLNLMSTYAGTQSVTLTNPTAGGSASFYLVRTGLRQ